MKGVKLLRSDVQQRFIQRWLGPGMRVGAVLVIGLSFLALPFLPLPDPPLAGWGAFFGRFHPMVVHFPIVLVIIPLLLEAASRFGRERTFLKLVPPFWGLAALSCMVAVLAGYLLYASGEYGGALIRRHLWAGVVLVVVVLGTGVLSAMPAVRSSRRCYGLYMIGALLTNLTVVYAGHLGGSLTHGEDFLVDAFPGWGYEASAVERLPRDELRVFHDLIMPALDERCMSCHNPQKAKGELDMTNFAAIGRGGESGKPMFVPHEPDSSELLRRVTFPIDHDDRMPPEGKPSLSADEVEILSWWIEEGANPDMRLGDAPPDLLREALIDRYLPRLVLAQRKRRRERRRIAALHEELKPIARRAGLLVEIDPETDSTLFSLAMRFPPEHVVDGDLARFAPHAESFSSVSLVSSEITDKGLVHLSRMRNLRELILQKTGIDGSGLVHLQSLPALEILNLSHTALNDSGAVNLLRLPSLKEVYVYNTAASDSMLEVLRTHLPEAEIMRIEGAPH